MWFTDYGNNEIGRINPTSGGIEEFPVTTASSVPFLIMQGPKHLLYFTEQAASKIGSVTTTGTINDVPIPGPTTGARGIASGADGHVWFTEPDVNAIGRFTPK
jgi:virginiamycin B lyase